jgi:hypothetical protein
VFLNGKSRGFVECGKEDTLEKELYGIKPAFSQKIKNPGF